MSVQAGIWNLDGAPANRELLASMSRESNEYGPDGESTYLSGPVGMLFRPFHTTKESRLECQPRVSHRGCVLTWDGRLDNREDLIEQLREDLRDEQTDVAIVMASVERWGADCFDKLVGDWALSFWNPLTQSLILARDCAAIRHLYYKARNNRVIWCTHLAPLVLSDGPFTVSDEYVAGYLASNPEAQLTPYREIRAVPPGHFVRFCHGNAVVRPYWSLSPKPRIQYKRDEEYVDHFRHVFRQAVRRRLRSDAPILAELSGGFDSSSIVCMADDIFAHEGCQTPRLDTVSYYDGKEPQGDERLYFSKVEEKRGRVGCHIESGISMAGAFVNRPSTFLATPGSFGVGSQVESELLRLMQGQGNRVLLSGIGGDELLGGVPNPSPQLADLVLKLKLLQLARELLAWSAAKRVPWIHILSQTLLEFLPPSVLAQVTASAKTDDWIDSTFARRTKLAVRQLGPTESLGFFLPSRRARGQTFLALARLMAFIRPPVAGCVERRYPYLDRTLVEFLISIPAGQLLRPGQRRSLMRRALAEFLPREILQRRTKGVTARRYMACLAESWPTLEELFGSPVSSNFGYINASQFQACLLAAKNGSPTHLLRMLRGVSLELWLRDLVMRGLVEAPRSTSQRFEAKSMTSRALSPLKSARALISSRVEVARNSVHERR